MNNARAFEYWKQEVKDDILFSQHFNGLQHYADWLLHEVQQLDAVTKHLLQVAVKGDNEIFLSDANLYMELFGLINIGWQWLKQGVKAQQQLNKNECTDSDNIFYRSKLHTMKFFFHYELRKTSALCARLMDDEILTIAQDEELIV